MPEVSETDTTWISNPKFARQVFWVMVGIVGWFIVMLVSLEMSLGEDSHGGGALLLPFVLAFVVVALGCTFGIPERFTVARSIIRRVLADSTVLCWCGHGGTSLIAD